MEIDKDLVHDNYIAYIRQLQEDYNSKRAVKKTKEEQEIFIRKTSKERIAHVYLFYGTEKKYFRVYRDLNEFRGYGEVIYLGLGIEPKGYVYKGKGSKQINNKAKPKGKNSYFKEGMKCCYCQDFLDENTCTREHVIPKHSGGKIIIPCCKFCNGEKGGLFLDGYIRLLYAKYTQFKSSRLLMKINSAKLLKEKYG